MRRTNSARSADMGRDMTFLGASVRVIRSSRRSSSIEISPEGEIILRMPYGTGEEEALQLMEDHESWIRKHLTSVLETREKAAGLPPLTDSEIRELGEKAKIVFPERVSFYAGRLGVSYKRITIRIMKGRWGSCTADGHLCFNLGLLLAPAEVLDSVVVHELCHLVELNHSDRFYKNVYALLPDYRKHHAWLKQNGRTILHRFYPETF